MTSKEDHDSELAMTDLIGMQSVTSDRDKEGEEKEEREEEGEGGGGQKEAGIGDEKDIQIESVLDGGQITEKAESGEDGALDNSTKDRNEKDIQIESVVDGGQVTEKAESSEDGALDNSAKLSLEKDRNKEDQIFCGETTDQGSDGNEKEVVSSGEDGLTQNEITNETATSPHEAVEGEGNLQSEVTKQEQNTIEDEASDVQRSSSKVSDVARIVSKETFETEAQPKHSMTKEEGEEICQLEVTNEEQNTIEDTAPDVQRSSSKVSDEARIVLKETFETEAQPKHSITKEECNIKELSDDREGTTRDAFPQGSPTSQADAGETKLSSQPTSKHDSPSFQEQSLTMDNISSRSVAGSLNPNEYRLLDARTSPQDRLKENDTIAEVLPEEGRKDSTETRRERSPSSMDIQVGSMKDGSRKASSESRKDSNTGSKTSHNSEGAKRQSIDSISQRTYVIVSRKGSMSSQASPGDSERVQEDQVREDQEKSQEEAAEETVEKEQDSTEAAADEKVMEGQSAEEEADKVNEEAEEEKVKEEDDAEEAGKETVKDENNTEETEEEKVKEEDVDTIQIDEEKEENDTQEAEGGKVEEEDDEREADEEEVVDDHEEEEDEEEGADEEGTITDGTSAPAVTTKKGRLAPLSDHKETGPSPSSATGVVEKDKLELPPLTVNNWISTSTESIVRIIPNQSFLALKPSANRILTKRWDKEQYKHHVDHVIKAKSRIDNTPPLTYKHNMLNLNKIYVERMRLSIIERENRDLMRRIATAMMTPSAIDNNNDAYERHREVFTKLKVASQHEFLRIAAENQALLMRLRAAKASEEVSNWREHWEYNKKIRMAQRKVPSDADMRKTGSELSSGKQVFRVPT